MKPWYGIDLDGTLAHYGKWISPEHIGAPIPKMVERVKQMIAEGKDVRIITARVFPIGINPELAGFKSTVEYIKRYQEAERAREIIWAWTQVHLGKVLEVQCWKDYGMLELWDDRAVQVIKNTGERADFLDVTVDPNGHGPYEARAAAQIYSLIMGCHFPKSTVERLINQLRCAEIVETSENKVTT